MSVQFTIYCDLCMTEITCTFDAADLAKIITNPEIEKRRIKDADGHLIDRCRKCFEEGRTEKK